MNFFYKEWIDANTAIRFQNLDIEMDEINAASKKSTESVDDSSTVEVKQNLSDLPIEIPTEISSSSESKGKETRPSRQPLDESLSIVIDDDIEEEPLISPPRKSARLSAKRRDSTTENEICSRKMSESPIPKRRSMRLNSTSSQDTPPAKAKEDLTTVKKMPTIAENEKDNAQMESNHSVKNDKNGSEQALIDELAAAFVDEFID